MKHLIFTLIGLAILMLTTPVDAQSGSPPIPNPPSADRYVLDMLNWLSADQESEINKIARQLDVEGNAEIYVATLDDCGSDKTQYRHNIFDTWKIGSQNQNGGLLILVCWYDGNPSRRSIEVKTDEKMQRIISDTLSATTAEDEFVSAFNQDQPGRGLVAMVKVFDDTIRRNTSFNGFQSFLVRIKRAWFPLSVAITLIIFQIYYARRAKAGDGWTSAGDFGDFGGSDAGGGDGGGSSTSF